MLRLAIVACLLAAQARPEDLIEEGKRLGKAGQLEAALAKFREAGALAPSAENDCLIALAYRRLDRFAHAELHLGTSREHGTPPKWCAEGLRKEVDQALRQGAFAPVDVQTTPQGAEIRISAFDDPFVAPRAIWLPLGIFELSATHAGFRGEKITLKIQTPNLYPVRVVLEPEQKQSAPDAAIPAPKELPPAPPPKEERSRMWPYLTAGAGVGAIALGAYFHADAIDNKDAAEKLKAGDPAFNTHATTFDRDRGAAIASYAVGALAIGLAVYLYLHEAPSDKRARNGYFALRWGQ